MIGAGSKEEATMVAGALDSLAVLGKAIWQQGWGLGSSC